jgi:hypothetical protein
VCEEKEVSEEQGKEGRAGLWFELDENHHSDLSSEAHGRPMHSGGGAGREAEQEVQGLLQPLWETLPWQGAAWGLPPAARRALRAARRLRPSPRPSSIPGTPAMQPHSRRTLHPPWPAALARSSPARRRGRWQGPRGESPARPGDRQRMRRRRARAGRPVRRRWC